MGDEEYIYYTTVHNWKVSKRTGQVTQVSGWTKETGTTKSKKKKKTTSELTLDSVSEEWM